MSTGFCSSYCTHLRVALHQEVRQSQCCSRRLRHDHLERSGPVKHAHEGATRSLSCEVFGVFVSLREMIQTIEIPQFPNFFPF